MKVNHEYLKSILKSFVEWPNPTMTVNEIDPVITNDEKQFRFHLTLLNDKGIIIRDDGDYGIGYTEGADGYGTWITLPLRLSASGHEYYEAINTPEIWEKIKSGATDLSIGSTMTVAKELMVAYLKKKSETLFG